jgi:flagellar biosynthesis/type III secretory pathway M-ring protein FliF/YscJ
LAIANFGDAMEGRAMEVIRQQFARMQAQFAALSASQRMLATSLVAIMVMTLVWWAKFAGSAEMEPVSSLPMSGEELVAIQSQLTAANIPTVVSGASILVPVERKVQAIAILASEKMLPHDGKGGFQDIISKLSPFDSEATKQKLWNVGLQQNLEQIICAMPGVDTCRVIIDATSREKVEGSVRPSASVAIRMRPPQKPERKLAEAIGYLVSGANAELSKSRVKVVIDGKPFLLQDREDEALGGGAEIAERQAAEEQRCEKKIVQALTNFGDVVATVSVKIDIVSSRTTETSVTDVKAKPVQSETESTETSAPAPGGGEPGTGANTGLSLATLPSADKQTSNQERSKESFQNFPSQKVENKEKPSGQPTIVSAAVHVPRSYFVNLLRGSAAGAKDPDEKAVEEQIEKARPTIRNTVAKAIGVPDENVIVVDASPVAPPMMAAIALEAPSASSSVTQSVKLHAKEIGLAALALVSLFMVSSMVKKGAPAPAIATAPESSFEPLRLGSGEVIAGEVGEGNPMLDGMELDDESIKAQQMVEQVSTMVKENPDDAANLVKRWLNRS